MPAPEAPACPAGRVLCSTSAFPRWPGDVTTPFVLHLVQGLHWVLPQGRVGWLATEVPSADVGYRLQVHVWAVPG